MAGTGAGLANRKVFDASSTGSGEDVYRGPVAITPPHIPGLTDWRPLARGGFAVVWEARQETLDRLVAVKVDQRRLDDEPERRRFLREAGAAGRMSAHRGIITVHDANILPDGRPYLVMDLCAGGSLTQYLASESRLTAQRIREIGLQIADALAATHARGVLHRDVKPANILVDRYDNVGLADFGLAAILGPETPPAEAFEALTPAYTAPEILRRQPPAATGDVYSLAATMYALLSGRPPRWPDEGTPTLAEVLELQQQPVRPLTDVDPDLMQLLLDALVPDPATRPDAAEFGRRLAALPLADQPAGASALGVDEGGAGRGVVDSRQRDRILLGALAALVLIGVLVAALVLRDRGASVAAPVPTTSASTAAVPESSTSAPTPTSPQVPPGFVDCSDALGDTSYCTTVQECFGSLISVMDTPLLATREDCAASHNYQTYAAGPLGYEVRLQSTLEADQAVKDLCQKSVLRRLGGPTDEQLIALPPQPSDGGVRIFRCIVGGPDRVGGLELKRPR